MNHLQALLFIIIFVGRLNIFSQKVGNEYILLLCNHFGFIFILYKTLLRCFSIFFTNDFTNFFPVNFQYYFLLEIKTRDVTLRLISLVELFWYSVCYILRRIQNWYDWLPIAVALLIFLSNKKQTLHYLLLLRCVDVLVFYYLFLKIRYNIYTREWKSKTSQRREHMAPYQIQNKAK